jgi:hypothetical protein
MMIRRNLFSVLSLALLALIACPAPTAVAQDSLGGGLYQQSTRTIRFFSASPSTCSTSRDNVGLNTTTGLLGWCSSANVWSYVAGTSGATFTGPVLLPNGTAAAPSIAFSSDSDGTGTGVFRSTANAIGLSTNGVERWTVNASGALNPFVANTYDIGGTTTIRDIGIGRNAIFSGATSGTATVTAPAIAGTTTITLPNASSTLPIFGQQITFAGPTAARTVTLPDANFTAARTDAAQQFTGVQTFLSAPVVNSVAIGTWTTVSFNAADFTASAGTWTVDSADVTSFAWSIVNKQMTVEFAVDATDVSATPAFLQILIPGGYTSARLVYNQCYVKDAASSAVAGTVQVNAADTKIYIGLTNGTAFSTTSSDNTRVRGQITFEVQ